MKLRNKNTGKIRDFGNLQVYAETENTDESQLLGNFDSLKQILEYYEDYIPKEPLIKDEKICKAIRAWADVQGIKEVKYIEGIASSDFHFMFEYGSRGTNRGIIHWGRGALITCLEDGKTYSITELCGEECIKHDD